VLTITCYTEGTFNYLYILVSSVNKPLTRPLMLRIVIVSFCALDKNGRFKRLEVGAMVTILVVGISLYALY